MKKKFLMIAAAAVVLWACSKNDTDEVVPTTKTPMELLTDGPWKYVEGPECILDNTWKFNADGSIVRNNGSIKCDGNETPSESGVWSFEKDGTMIDLVIEGDTTHLKIQELTQNSFISTSLVNTPNGSEQAVPVLLYR